MASDAPAVPLIDRALIRALLRYVHRLERDVAPSQPAYHERNQVVALLARHYPSGIRLSRQSRGDPAPVLRPIKAKPFGWPRKARPALTGPAIRPVTITRKNSLFAGSDVGASYCSSGDVLIKTREFCSGF